jgi:hypothetical protein
MAVAVMVAAAGLLPTQAGCKKTAENGEKVTLRAKRTPGIYVTTEEQQIDRVAEIHGIKVDDDHQKRTTVGVMQISQPDAAGGKTMTIAFKRVAIQTTMGGRTISYDSDNPNAGAETADSVTAEMQKNMAALYGLLPQIRLTVKIDSKGDETQVSGLGDLFDRIAGQDEALRPLAESMKRMMEQVSKQGNRGEKFMLPPGPVAVGTQWKPSRTESDPMFGKSAVAMTCTLKGIENGIARIEYGGTEHSESGSPNELAGGQTKLNKRDERRTGTMDFDIAKGMAVRTTDDQDTTTDMTVTPPGEPQQTYIIREKKHKVSTVKEGTPADTPAMATASSK